MFGLRHFMSLCDLYLPGKCSCLLNTIEIIQLLIISGSNLRVFSELRVNYFPGLWFIDDGNHIYRRNILHYLLVSGGVLLIC